MRESIIIIIIQSKPSHNFTIFQLQQLPPKQNHLTSTSLFLSLSNTNTHTLVHTHIQSERDTRGSHRATSYSTHLSAGPECHFRPPQVPPPHPDILSFHICFTLEHTLFCGFLLSGSVNLWVSFL